MINRKWIVIISSIALVVPSLVLAAMSSTNYYIYADSVDFGGGAGTSTSFTLQETLGGYATGISTSTSYQIKAGYQADTIGTLSFELDGNSLDFGSLATVGSVVTGNVQATINTDSESGYVLSVSSVSGTSLTAVADGVVNGAGGSEEYGLAVSGVSAAYAGDVAVVNSLVLSSSVSPAISEVTTLTFKAVRGSNSTAGTYSQNITLTAAANI